MENYIVSARKYRPLTFDSVVGQRALTTTLKNAIASHKLGHAYLFCGPRGVGKTTCARIFAKTINCLHPKENGEACNECESCKAFNEQRSYNIHELDAASNNSVECVRDLIDQVRVPPQIGQYSVYIIDEVHMLSQAAFNAFLKTLEEPPHHAIFILATTEKHKLLPTILSRCQIYDFNRISVNDIVEHLQYVAQTEGVKAEVEALDVIAQKADGGMRDALSIFDQVVSFTNGNITYEGTIANLNVLDSEYYFKLTDLSLENKVADCMLLFNDILNKGFDGNLFINGLGSHFRNLLVGQDAATLPLLEVSDRIKQHYQEQAKKCKPQFLRRAMKLCSECDLNFRFSKNKRFLVELTLIQIAQLTQEEDGEVCGRRPTKRLKPLFKQQAAPKAATEPTPQANVPVANATVSKAPQPEPQQAAQPASQEKKIPKMSVGRLGLSIKRDDVETTSKEAPSEPSAAVRLNEPEANLAGVTKDENRPFEEKELSFYWFDFANGLPKDDVAMANRMKNMKLNLLEDYVFEAIVDNDMVEKYLNGFVPRIEQHLREKLHNRRITMKVRVSAPQEVVRAYSRKEQCDLLIEKNPELKRLIDTFNLQFG